MIDCSILTFQNVHYLIPTLAIAQAVNAPTFTPADKHATSWGRYEWHSNSLPIVSFDLLPLKDRKFKSLKLAILHGVIQNSTVPYYFGVVFEGRVHRVKLASDGISWAEENKMQAMIVDKNESLAVTLVDLPALTSRVSTLVAASTHVAK